jgi:hypothetical protein
MHDLEDIKTRIERLARALDAPGHALPTFGRSDDSGRPHIEAESGTLHYIVCERGTELERFSTASTEELLYRVFRDVTSSMAVAYELAHRVRGEDSRRQMFAQQIALLHSINPRWALRRGLEHKSILAEHPFDDGSPAGGLF